MIPCYLQSIHIVDVQCHNKVVNKPTVITDYNKNMGAVDIVDQYFGDYSIAWKRRKKYYKKMFFHLLDQNTLNLFSLQKAWWKIFLFDALFIFSRWTYWNIFIIRQHSKKRSPNLEDNPLSVWLKGIFLDRYLQLIKNGNHQENAKFVVPEEL